MQRIRNKPVRIIVKILLYCFCFLLLLFTGTSVYVEINKKSILEKLRAGVSKNLRSEIRYKDADITIWRNFPFIRIHFFDISVEDSVYHEPFFAMKEVAGQVSIFQYFRKNIELRNLYFSHGTLHVFTDTSGYTNKYLLQYKKKNGNDKKMEVTLNRATFNNVRVILENRKRNKYFDFLFKTLHADIAKSGEDYDIRLDNKAIINTMSFDRSKGSYLEGQAVNMNVDLHLDRKEAALSFDEEKFEVNDQLYRIKGRFIMKGEGFFTLSIRTKDAPYQKIVQVFPGNIASRLKKFSLEKPLDVEATLEGPLAYKTVPWVNAAWKTSDNVLTTEVAKFTRCSFTGNFTNEKIRGAGITDQNSAISLRTFTGNWEGIALNGKNITVTNLADPFISFSLASSTDFRTLNNKLGLRTIEFIEGSASLDLSYSGPLQKDLSIIDRLQGQLKFQNGTIRYIPRGFTFRNCSGSIVFSDNLIKADQLNCDLGKNHFVVNVTGNNMSGLSSGDASKASIACTVYSPSLNIDEMKGLFAAKKTATSTKSNTEKLIHTASRVDDIMDNGSLSVFLNSNTVRYKSFTGQDLRGDVVFANNDLLIKNVSVTHANGRLDINASIKQDAHLNTASAKVNLQNVDVKKLFHAFDNFGQDGILSENIQGILNAFTNIGLAFDNTGKLIPGSIKGTVDFSLDKGALINFEPLQDIKNFIFRKKDMSHVTFAELKDKLDIDGYKVRINKMEIQSSAMAMFVDGVYDIKKNDTKISIQVPLKGLKQRDSTYIPKNIGLDAKAGTSIYLEGKNDKKTGKVKIGLNTTKTIRKLF